MARCRVTVVGGGPAGSSAAIAAALEGSPVTLYEKSRLPRHKVCGEFLSPGSVPILKELGVFDAILARGPAIVEQFTLTFGARRVVTAPLEESAYGLSRYALDDVLLTHAMRLGVHVERSAPAAASAPLVIAHGRSSTAPASARGRRLFGFKAHFSGLSNAAIELYFSDSAYVGVSPIEGGGTNVCGLASEGVLAQFGFDFDQVVRSAGPLRDRVAPLRRETDWLATGPLVFHNHMRRAGNDGAYRAGDALAFVDPFTGSGMLNAITTGKLAGHCAATGVSAAEYLKICRSRLRKPFLTAALCRLIVRLGWAQRLAGVVPPGLLYRMTRVA